MVILLGRPCDRRSGIISPPVCIKRHVRISPARPQGRYDPISNRKMMDQSFIFTIFEGLPRQGPGDDRCTKKAFERTGVKADANILDIGCGSGMQTIALAGLCRECRITAVDIYQPFLDVLNERAAKRNLLSRINIVPASMDELPFEKETFDLIWAEGSIFIIGIGNGISQWKNYLKPGGKIAFTDVVWFSKTPHPGNV